MADDQNRRSPHPADRHVGQRVRGRRKGLGMNQEALADALGLTVQQVQKYELGTNRVSASKLYEMARVLHVPVAYFFEGLDDPASGAQDPQVDAPPGLVSTLLASRDGLALATAFNQIPPGRIRRRIVDLVLAIVAEAP